LQLLSSEDLLIQERYGAIVRSISGDPHINVRDWNFYQHDELIGQLAPHLNPIHFFESWSNHRGMLDGLGLRIAHSDLALHRKMQPLDLIGSLVFEVLEQIRIESICPIGLSGTKQNIQSQFIAWLQQFMAKGGTEGSINLLLLAIFGGAWSRLNNAPLPQLMQDTIEIPRAELYSETGPLLERLKQNRFDQEKFAVPALEMAELVSNLVAKEYQAVPSIRIKRRNASKNQFQIPWEFSDEQKHPIAENSPHPNGVGQQNAIYERALGKYRIFDRSFDVEMRPLDTMRVAQLITFREEIDETIHSWSIPWLRLIKTYGTLFSKPIRNGWESSEEGLLNRKQLSRVIASQNASSIYQKEYAAPKPDSTVSFLIDCSGSMKENRLFMAAWVDIMVRILDKANVPCEVLGYTTASWNGGQSIKKWHSAGKPKNPGRLSEQAHWIFKDFKTSWKNSRLSIAGMLKPDIYKESLDGEALLWAAKRSLSFKPQFSTSDLALDEFKHHIILLSDGCPMDRATQQANEDEDYLMDHLKLALKWAENQNQIRVWGCGIGQEMRGYFSKRLSWNENDAPVKLMNAWAQELQKQL
jgi:cobaltochelatase CobT